MRRLTVPSPLGPLTLTEESGAITALRWGTGGDDDSPVLADAARQLEAYFAGRLQGFDLPLHVGGTETQRAVCAAIAAIPFGETRRYGDLGRVLGLPAQVVGQGCGGNPIPILIPCHRVLAACGLGGFSGGAGIETKVWLLRHESAAGLLL